MLKYIKVSAFHSSREREIVAISFNQLQKKLGEKDRGMVELHIRDKADS